MKFLREPLLHFLLIGALIYLAYGLFAEPVLEDDGKTIVVSAGEVAWMGAAWQKRYNRPPTAAERDGLIQQYIRETVLYREALAMGLEKDDVVIRRRLGQKLEFLAQDLASMVTPTEDDLQAYFDEHQERYQEPDRFTLTQVFIDPDKRGDATLPDAERIKAKLVAEGGAIKDAGALGDGFMLRNYYPEVSRLDIQKLFGSGFAEAVVELTPEQWHGPVLSGYGVHLVYVHDRIEAPPPLFANVRERVLQDWQDDRRETLNEQFYAGLRNQYTIVIEDPAEADDIAALNGKTP